MGAHTWLLETDAFASRAIYRPVGDNLDCELEGAYDFRVTRVARVEIVHGCRARVVDVPSAGLEVGRGETVGLVLDAPSVSKRHARFSWDGDDLLVEDLGSTNKVFRDGLMLGGRAALADGDELVLGEVVLRVGIVGQLSVITVEQLPDTENFMSP